MDASTRVNSVSEDIGFELYVCSQSCEKSYIEHRQSTCTNMKEIVMIKPEALDISSISEKDNVIVPDVGIAGGGSLHVQDSQEQLSAPNSTSDQDDKVICNEIDMCQEFCHSLSLDAKGQKCLSKCATFPSSKEVQSCSSIEGRADSLSTAVQDQCSSAFETSTYARSMSLPTSLSLVSAMKGARAQNGTLPKMDLRVKWAPEVYDPPTTSMSHTVKSHHQRPKAKKKDNHKHKHNKGKSSRGSGGERKHSNRKIISSIPDSLDARLQASRDRLLLDGYGKSKVEILEYGVSSQEAKCGSSFLRETLPKVHLPVGEAS